MTYLQGAVVQTKAGRDKGLYAIIGEQGKYVLLVNGHQYRINKPKRKNPKHLALVDNTINVHTLTSDKLLKRELALLSANAQQGG